MEVINFKKPPIANAVIELRFNPINLDEEKGFKQLADLVIDDFPNQEFQKNTSIQIEIGPGKKIPTVDELTLSIKCLSEDKTRQIVIKENSVACGVTSNYTDWEDISSILLTAWGKINQELKITTITRLGVRFINVIVIPEHPFDFDHYFTIGPRTPAGIPEIVLDFANKMTFVHDKEPFASSIRYSYNPSTPHNVVLDIDTYQATLISADQETLTSRLTTIREYKNQVFLGCLQEKTIQLFE